MQIPNVRRIEALAFLRLDTIDLHETLAATNRGRRAAKKLLGKPLALSLEAF
jgi:hypothetical protein